MARLAFPIFLLAALASGCGSEELCTADARMGLYVLFDGGGPDDSVSASALREDGNYSEDLRCTHDETEYQCAGLQERPGSYVVTATLNGDSEQRSITLADDGCHVVTEVVKFFDGSTSSEGD